MRLFRLGCDTIEIARLEPIPQGVQAIFRAARDRVKYGFGADGRHEWERVRFFGRQPDDYVADIFRVLRLVGKPGADIIFGSVANTTTVARPVAGTGTAPIDGRALRFVSGGEAFSTLRSGSGTGASATTTDVDVQLVAHGSGSDTYTQMSRFGFGFDTSPVGSDTISSATIQLYGAFASLTGLGNPGVGIVSFTPGSESTIATTDYPVAGWGATDFATRINAGSWTNGGFNDFSLNASGIAAINTSGNTFFGLRLGWDIDNDTTGLTWSASAQTRVNVSTADETGTAQDPVITIEHAAAGGVLGIAARAHLMSMVYA